MFKPKNSKPDVENAADAKMPGDKQEDKNDKKAAFSSSKLAGAKTAAKPIVTKKLAAKKKPAKKA